MFVTRERIDRSLTGGLVRGTRLALLVLVIPLLLGFSAPLWHMNMIAPQYPEGLGLEIFAYTVAGDVAEVNTLNHYIGMGKIDRAALSDLDWIPFALGALALLALRVAAVGDLRSLIDLIVLFGYFSVFSMARFYYKLYVFGHNLDPKAPIHMDPFTPPVLGTEQIANFTATSFPGMGTLWIGIFALGLGALLLLNLYVQVRKWRAEPQS
jgi:hypothetical protein